MSVYISQESSMSTLATELFNENPEGKNKGLWVLITITDFVEMWVELHEHFSGQVNAIFFKKYIN